MKARSPNQQPEEVNASLAKKGFIEGSKLAALGAIVGAGFLPLDYVMQVLHTMPADNTGNETRRLSWSYVAAKNVAKLAASAYVNTAKAATIKNTVISQRGKVEEAVTSRKTEEKGAEEEGAVKVPTAIPAPVLVSGSIGFIDTTASHYHRNQRTWNLESFRNQQYQAPVATSAADYWKLFKTGYPICLLKNVLTIAGFYISPALKDIFKGYLPERTAENTAIAATGMSVGAFTNLFDIIYKNQVLRINLQKLTAPSVIEVFKELYRKEGFRFTVRGLPVSALYSMFAYKFVPIAEELVNEHVAPRAAQGYDSLASLLNSSHSFFRTAHRDSDKQEPNSERNEQELQKLVEKPFT